MATTFVPTYAQPTASVAPRGGPDHLDRNLATGSLQVDALGRLAKARGVNRLVSRIVRAYLTYQGTWWANPNYGSQAVPTYITPSDVALALSQVALTEAKVYLSTQLAPDERITSLKVNSIQLSTNVQDMIVSITITTAAGTAYSPTLVLPGA